MVDMGETTGFNVLLYSGFTNCSFLIGFLGLSFGLFFLSVFCF